MIARMTTPASKTAVGSVGTVDTQFLDLAAAARARLRTIAASDPHRLRDLRDAVAGARQRDSGLPRAERRCPRGRLLDDAAAESTRDGFRAEERDGTSGRGLGWWDGMIGPGKAFDTDRFFVVSTNLLGGCRGTTGPSSDEPGNGPALRIGLSGHHGRGHGAGGARVPERARDCAAGRRRRRLARRACRRSSGPFSIGDQVDAIIPIASTHALHPQGVAWNAIARNAITADPDWQGGHYYGTGRAPTAGMGVARMVGHITYLSAVSLNDKFGRRLQFADDIRYTPHRARVRSRELPAPPGGYLREALRRQHISLHLPGSFLFRPRPAVRERPAHATRSATCALERCSSRSAPTGSIRRRVPRSWRPRFARPGKEVELHVIDAPYGHDCFLLEEARQTPMIQQFLAR